MSAATTHPVPARPTGATATQGAVHHHLLGDVLRAVRVYVETAFRVVVLGEYAEEAGVRRR